ncbi:MAG: lysine--tRNA ligase, partial [Candidatus Thermoplasmatota archaeon]|nr:lysine--tRNA ligase [Candidatus Thermoplasmatota archaeon]
MHWADVAASRLLERGNQHVISSGITPSGPIHVGSMREILTADAVARAVHDKGGEAERVYVADTADPLRKVYPFLDKSYSKWVGHPL